MIEASIQDDAARIEDPYGEPEKSISTDIIQSSQIQNEAASIAPIRSMSVRSFPHRTSVASSYDSNSSQKQSQILELPSIQYAITRLENAGQESKRPSTASSSITPAPEIPHQKQRTLSYVARRVAEWNERIESIPKPIAPVSGSAEGKRLSIVPQEPSTHTHDVKASIKACMPAHGLLWASKSSAARAVLTRPYSGGGYRRKILKSALRTTNDEACKKPTETVMHGDVEAGVETSDNSIIEKRSDFSIKTNPSPEQESETSSPKRSVSVRFEELPAKPATSISNLGLPPILRRDPCRITEEGRSQSVDITSQDTVSDYKNRERENTTQAQSIAPSSRSSQFSRVIRLKGTNFVDLPNDVENLDDHTHCHHAPVARDWHSSRKRLTASIACANICCISLLIGVYAGEVPAIQYVIVDEDHYIVLGNTMMYIGLAISHLLFWTLPLLHGRKPYTVAGLVFGLCLLIPQAVAASDVRPPEEPMWIGILLASRLLNGIALGLCDMNIQATLLDLFGASLRSHHSTRDIPDGDDVRRQGGGLGIWLGIWSWCTIGPISIGFMIGASIIDHASVTWGFWGGTMVLTFALLLNIVSPEVRRAAFRGTVAQVTGSDGCVNRVARGEIKMHLRATGPSWFGQEIKAGMELSWLMIRQFGFSVLTLYTAWVYCQFTLILVLLGALSSTVYHLRPMLVGACVLSLAFGAILAIPFQKASLLSRSHWRSPTSASMTMHNKFKWSSHVVRRILFTISLPVSAIAYAATSTGPTFSIVLPCLTSSFVGFFSAMAIAECTGLLLETFDISDLYSDQLGTPARQNSSSGCRVRRLNFTCYPRISAGAAVMQTAKYFLAAVSTAIAGSIERRLGSVQAAAIVAAILLLITLLLSLVLFRWKTVQVQQYHAQPQEFENADSSMGSKRKISILEAGKLSRYTEFKLQRKASNGPAGSQ